VAHPRDRRARTVRLTERGWDCIEKVVAHWADVERRWAELVGPAELATVRDALRAYVADAPAGLRPGW
jgi:DNA-binding MarR family transcriptional regulator